MNDLEREIEAALTDWFSEIHMSPVVKRQLDGAVIVTPLPSDEEDDASINLTTLARALADAPPLGVHWQEIEAEPADDSEIWISDGKSVWLGTAHKDGSLKLPSRSACKFWCPANKPAPPLVPSERED